MYIMTAVVTPNRRSRLTQRAILFSIVILGIVAKSRQEHVADMCYYSSVESAAHVVFRDGVKRYFISNGPHYWFLDPVNEMPDEKSAFKIPHNIEPDVAILKDTRKCSNGYLSLMLIQMTKVDGTNEAKWISIELKIGNWKDNQTGSAFWKPINEIARCDLDANVCTTTDNYFATMSFDFKTKLDSAFGTIGHIAYFIQGYKMFKVVYQTECISNLYNEVVAYPGVDIFTTTTAALSQQHENNLTIVLFDYDVHLAIVEPSIINVTLSMESNNNSVDWKVNAHYLFERCPLTGISLAYLLQNIFTGSKRHYRPNEIILMASSMLIMVLMFIILAVIVVSYWRKKDNDNEELDNTSETNDEQLIDKDNQVQVKSQCQNGEQQKTLLQTSC